MKSKYQYFIHREPYLTTYYRVDPDTGYYWEWCDDVLDKNDGDFRWRMCGEAYGKGWLPGTWRTFYEDPQHYPFEVSNPVTPEEIKLLEVLLTLGYEAVKDESTN